MQFPVSGVEVNPLVPLLVAFLVSALTAPAGVSGAFLLLPFQVSVLGFTSPAVSPTNLIYNVFAAPGGVYRYVREGRVVWPLAWAVVLGTLPGAFAGAWLRVTLLSDPEAFRVFVGLVLLYLGVRLLWATFGRRLAGRRAEDNDGDYTLEPEGPQPPGTNKEQQDATLPASSRHSPGRSARRVSFEFAGKRYTFGIPSVLALSLVVGTISGIYSIGGASIISPFLVAIFGLPIYAVAGAALIGTFVTSVAGVAFFEVLDAANVGVQARVAPDYLLGAVLGAGGLAGTYAGARLQRYLPDFWIRAVLGILVTLLAVSYLS